MTDRETSRVDPDNQIDTILPGKSDETCDEHDESTDVFATQIDNDFVDQFATFVAADGRQINRNALTLADQ
jgi:hypothetical protein